MCVSKKLIQCICASASAHAHENLRPWEVPNFVGQILLSAREILSIFFSMLSRRSSISITDSISAPLKTELKSEFALIAKHL